MDGINSIRLKDHIDCGQCCWLTGLFYAYEISVEQGHSNSQYNLSVCYYYGIGVKKDVKKAVELYQRATEQEYADAQNNLGDCYYYGTGVGKDVKKAAEQGDADAQYNLGIC